MDGKMEQLPIPAGTKEEANEKNTIVVIEEGRSFTFSTRGGAGASNRYKLTKYVLR